MRPPHSFDFGSETGEDSVASIAAAKSRLQDIEQQLNQVHDHPDHSHREMPTTQETAALNKDAAMALLEIGQNVKAWWRARPLFDFYVELEQWQECIEICEILFHSGQNQSIVALGHGVWLAVTFPVSPQFTATMLQYVIDETPDNADGAAVAAATAAYVYNLRKHLVTDSDLYLHTMQMLTSVARRHSNIHGQAEFDDWMARLELENPEKFLPRLGNVIEVLVQDEWWFDRDLLQEKIPA